MRNSEFRKRMEVVLNSGGADKRGAELLCETYEKIRKDLDSSIEHGMNCLLEVLGLYGSNDSAGNAINSEIQELADMKKRHKLIKEATINVIVTDQGNGSSSCSLCGQDAEGLFEGDTCLKCGAVFVEREEAKPYSFGGSDF